MHYIILLAKGFIMGIANLIPGVSGGTIAVTMGIYEEFITSIGHFFKDIKKHIKFLLPLLLGIAISVLSMSGVIEYCFENYPLYTALLFTGLVAGGIPNIKTQEKTEYNLQDKKTTKFSAAILFLSGFLIVIVMAVADSFRQSGTQEAIQLNVFTALMFILMGAIVSGTMMLPGVSGSLLLVLFGYYDTIIGAISDFVRFENLLTNTIILAFFGIGVLIGLVVTSRIVSFLFEKFRHKTLIAVLGFMVASVISVPYVALQGVQIEVSVLSVILSLFFTAIGFVIALKFGKEE